MMNSETAMVTFTKFIYTMRYALQCACISSGMTLLLPTAHAQPATTGDAQSQASTVTTRAQPQLADAILVVVNSEVITRREFMERLKDTESRLQKIGRASCRERVCMYV